MRSHRLLQPRLLYVSTLDHIVRVMLPHLDAARKAGFTVEVACQVTRFKDEVLQHADAVYDVPLQRFPLHPLNLIALFRLTRLIRARRYAIVHSHNPTGGIVGRVATTLADTGAIRAYTAHGFHFHRHGGRITNALYRTVESIAGHLFSDGVLVINEEDNAAAQHGVVPQERLFLTGGVGVSAKDDFDPEKITDTQRKAVRAEVGIEEGQPVLTVIGEMIPRKRQADAILAFSRLRLAGEPPLLLLVGEGALHNRLKQFAHDLGIAERCRFLGFRRDVAAILAVSDILLFPSQQEGLPCSVQESLAMGVPVIATDVRGNSDLVDDSCGRIVPLGDPDALAAAATELLALSPEARQQMGKEGREKMLSLYDRAHCVSQWLEIYQTLMARKGITLPLRRQG